MSSVSAALNSPRLVRLLPWIAGAILAVGIVIFLLVFFRNTSDVAPPDKSAGPAVKQTSQRTVPLDPSAQKLAITFIKTAVARKNPTLAYQISGPEIRQGLTLAQWTRDWHNPDVGISVIPYPVDQLKGSPFRVDYSYANEALLEVALLPKSSAKIKPQIFFIGLRKYGNRWLVNYWGPHNSIALPSQQ